MDGFQITQIQIGFQADQSPGYATFIKGERTFTASYSVTGDEFVIKVNEMYEPHNKNPNNVISKQVRRKPSCTITEDS